ncbi:MAG: hypothetical protein RQ847_00745 [Wenzhouxiangellaceae bacterium]|nr:hypothetical protein [Wenzhouxiangellaceae bacterium]
MNNFRYSFYRVPQSPLARFGLVLLGIAILAVSFFVGLVFLAVAAGLAILGAIGMTIRNWLNGRRNPRRPEDLQVEYRVIRRDRD